MIVDASDEAVQASDGGCREILVPVAFSGKGRCGAVRLVEMDGLCVHASGVGMGRPAARESRFGDDNAVADRRRSHVLAEQIV